MKYNEFLKTYKSYKKYEKNDRFLYCRYYLEKYKFNLRIGFISKLLLNEDYDNYVIELKFWENDEFILSKMKDYNYNCTLVRTYKNGQTPGILAVEGKKVDLTNLGAILLNHFNYELAEKPALNIGIILYLESADFLKVYDFYDDRGFTISYYSNENIL